ncbi:MAG: MATE family efflux transporter, partial [Muribaculaceae bacterium]|nr:MATE family efflux transporter [Muribaculaceae bacterium]
IALGASMFNILYWPFAFLRLGTSGMTAIAFGAKNSEQQSLILYRGLLVGLLASVIIIVASSPLCDVLLWFMKADMEVAILTRRYFHIVVWGAPAVLLTYVLTGWFLGMQSSRRPMIISIVINTINIAISPFLAFTLGMKFTGVAIGTLTAQWMGLFVGLLMCRKYALAKTDKSKILNLSELKRYFTVNRDIFLRTLCLIAVTMWFTREGARQSDLMLAVNALLMQLFILFSYMIDGFAFAGEALTGRFVGSGNRTALMRCIRALMKWGATLAILYSVIYLAAGEEILSLLTDNHLVRSLSKEYLPWAITVPLCGFLAFIWDGIYIGATATRGMLISMAGAMIVFFCTYFLLFPVMHNHGLWLAFILYLLSRGLFQTFLFGRFFPAPGNIVK